MDMSDKDNNMGGMPDKAVRAETAARNFIDNTSPGMLDAHLIADMLRIETISNEVRSLGSKVDQLSDRMTALETSQIQHSAQTGAHFRTLEASVEQVKNSLDANERRTAERFSKLEGWLFSIVGLSVAGLIAVIVSIVSGIVS
jgi:riboflavin synthase